ncbi:MAG: sulfurtransferase [Pseudomonadota bacterium]|nr:sulfurtransferase [Pseudomonadota bacterium]
MDDAFSSLVDTDWLADNLGDPNLAIVDASRHLPAANRDARAEFEKAHISGARFLDLYSLTDTASQVPSALPTCAQIAGRLGELGIRAGQRIILYDDSDTKTSARAWFALTCCGVENVAILNGGFAKWRDESRPVKTGEQTCAAASPLALHEGGRVVTKQTVFEVATANDALAQIIDARSADRVFGTGIDPVHGGQNGRIPGSLSVPFGQVFNPDGTYKSADALRCVFSDAGIDLQKPIITSCGSGVTASVLLFALHLIGLDDAQLYDGSWQEWSADPATPKVQGP